MLYFEARWRMLWVDIVMERKIADEFPDRCGSPLVLSRRCPPQRFFFARIGIGASDPAPLPCPPRLRHGLFFSRQFKKSRGETGGGLRRRQSRTARPNLVCHPRSEHPRLQEARRKSRTVGVEKHPGKLLHHPCVLCQVLAPIRLQDGLGGLRENNRGKN